jgi:hypothetical protein
MPCTIVNFPGPLLLPYHWLMNLPFLSRWITRAQPQLFAGDKPTSFGLSFAWLSPMYASPLGEKANRKRLPQQPLSFCFVPVTPLSANPKRLDKFAFRTDYLNRCSGSIAYPDVVLRVYRYAMSLNLMTDDIVADSS